MHQLLNGRLFVSFSVHLYLLKKRSPCLLQGCCEEMTYVTSHFHKSTSVIGSDCVLSQNYFLLFQALFCALLMPFVQISCQTLGRQQKNNYDLWWTFLKPRFSQVHFHLCAPQVWKRLTVSISSLRMRSLSTMESLLRTRWWNSSLMCVKNNLDFSRIFNLHPLVLPFPHCSPFYLMHTWSSVSAVCLTVITSYSD